MPTSVATHEGDININEAKVLKLGVESQTLALQEDEVLCGEINVSLTNGSEANGLAQHPPTHRNHNEDRMRN